MRTIRAFISDDYRFAAGGVDLQVGMQELDDRGMPVRTDAVLTLQDENGSPVEAKWRWRFIDDHERGMVLNGATLNLQEGVGQAILEALARHYHGTNDTHRMANDLGRERQRRDQAEDRLWEMSSMIVTGAQVSRGHVEDVLNMAVQAQALQAQTSGNPTEMGTSMARLVDYLPELLLRVARLQPLQNSPQEDMMFHTGIDNHCRGHMPWDFSESCTSR